MIKRFKIRLAATLRKWAQSLDPRVVARPQLVINSYDMQRFKIRKRVNLMDLEGQRRYDPRFSRRDYDPAEHQARVMEIIKQETIVEAAQELAPLLEVVQIDRFLEIRADFYFKQNDETNL